MTNKLYNIPMKRGLDYFEWLLWKFMKLLWPTSITEQGKPARYLLHFKNKLINSSCFRRKFPSITDRHSTSDVRSIAVPFTASINQKDLRVEVFRMSMGKVVLVMVIMWPDRPPRKFTIITAIVKSRCTGGSSYYWKVCLMHGPWDSVKIIVNK